MIIRKYAACYECGTVHVLRIGVGGENVQAHQFTCANCRSDMSLRIEMGRGATFGPNATEAEPDDEAPVVNLHPSFVFGKDEIHSATAFPSLEMGARMVQNLIAARRNAGHSGDLDDLVGAATAPRISDEWDALRATWSLQRHGNQALADKRMEHFLDAHAFPERPDTLADWMFQFTGRLAAVHFQPHFEALFEQLQAVLKSEDFERFAEYYEAQLSAAHGQRYFELMKAYLGLFTEFSQVHHAVSFGIPVDDECAAGSSNFDATRMIYGNAFEAFASNVEILAMLNNILTGRPFDWFEKLSLADYLKLDKANRFNAFAANPAFASICLEADSRLRNASHHGGMEFDRESGTISYRTGKGGLGEVETLSYAHFLAKCSAIFIQAMLLFRLELLIASRFGLRCPL